MNVKSLSPEECKKILDQNDDAILLDVRSENECKISRIPNSTLIPLDKLQGRMDELDKNKKILAYCASGNRSQIACHILQTVGFDNCLSMQGGINDWQQAGFDVERK